MGTGILKETKIVTIHIQRVVPMERRANLRIRRLAFPDLVMLSILFNRLFWRYVFGLGNNVLRLNQDP